MNMSPILSFVVPVYKTPENLLRQTLESILSCSKINLELICVDDSPGDCTSAVLAEFAQRDKRIRVLTNDHNRGVSYSRNRGIDAAWGKYIAFQDADDLALMNGYEELLMFAQENDLDVIRGARPGEDENGIYTPLRWTLKVDNFNCDNATLKIILGWQSWSACVGIYRRSFLKSIYFLPVVCHYEDSLFNARVLTAAKSIGVMNVPIYRVVGHPNSAARRPPVQKTYMEYALAARYIALIVSEHSLTHAQLILRFYAYRAVYILFSDRRARTGIRSKRLQRAFALSACHTAQIVKQYMSFPLRLALTFVQFYPMGIFLSGGILWNVVKGCMMLESALLKRDPK